MDEILATSLLIDGSPFTCLASPGIASTRESRRRLGLPMLPETPRGPERMASVRPVRTPLFKQGRPHTLVERRRRWRCLDPGTGSEAVGYARRSATRNTTVCGRAARVAERLRRCAESIAHGTATSATSSTQSRRGRPRFGLVSLTAAHGLAALRAVLALLGDRLVDPRLDSVCEIRPGCPARDRRECPRA